MKKTIRSAISLLLTAATVFTLGACTKNGNSSGTTVTIGSKDSTENLLVAEVYALALKDNGFHVNRKFKINSTLIHSALTSGQIDLYPEYTSTGLLAVLKLPLITDPQNVYNTVKVDYLKQFNLVWLNYSPANDSQCLVITQAASAKYNIRTISDLQKGASQIRFASQDPFDQRSDGMPALTVAYGPFHFKSEQTYDNGLKYQILANDKADVTVAYATEGQLSDTSKFLVLEDDKHVWPPYNLAPVVRKQVLDKNAKIATVLNKVSALINTKTMTQLNAKVDVNKQNYEDVAKTFYDSIKSKVHA
ncbi:glycine betaine ABC transporter substrate-binding protein [Ethanoligenens harbinense]|uniref:Substrate-binding region of ABC-type glycine betaine transport system n=1 Tax=Ethanoligenens harbinense (strain DSM 18485 / JCM 12961 / CGMCC 1.5033 / YUAN-3) TaxID=663278 RepID=E6U3D2_ETHHY|nr:glycine betaine ABC transporter substrate-binding protein [Ethanoligenens harbinense]ADU26424.1 Substrate-binding region of ABC-type glycine betaine transport system [Ethanoligenens harbinense YUAN-3]AVQ97360.1 glycine/betaine ABC transporter substrate-binding protein [Ethanoligenens harbinense YUAN-3]AYF40019.1 glycine/betaine ABC transporter substrate-binding protein [Ethanoligenens harbinense]AYF42850.1 glycine/betaine ABC transporter substrate-binding protein [Ethanoligenens harbinense]